MAHRSTPHRGRLPDVSSRVIHSHEHGPPRVPTGRRQHRTSAGQVYSAAADSTRVGPMKVAEVSVSQWNKLAPKPASLQNTVPLCETSSPTRFAALPSA